MKKGLVVLLIAVLALGAVFADVTSFTGKLTSKITYDLNGESLVFAQEAEAKAKFNFGLFKGSSADGAAQGEGYPYAVIEGAIAIDFEDFEFSFGDNAEVFYKADKLWDGKLSTNAIVKQQPGSKVYTDINPNTEVMVYDKEVHDWVAKKAWKVYDPTAIRFSWAQDDADDVITTAKIVGEKWELDLLKNFGVGNFATNAIADSQEFNASAKVKASAAFDMDNSTDDDNGVTFTYDGYKVAVNRFVFNNKDKSDNNFELSFQTKDFEFEGVTGTVGVNFKSKGQTNGDVVNSANVSVKAGYEVSDFVLAAASDVQIAANNTEFDVAFGANYKEDAVKFDFYYATLAIAKSPYEKASDINKAVFNLKIDNTKEEARYLLTYKNKDDSIAETYYNRLGEIVKIKNLMSLKTVVDVAKLADLGPVSALSVTVDGHDILNKDTIYENTTFAKKYAWNAELNAALEDYGTTAKFGVKKFTVDTRRFYAEATTDFAKFAELPVNTLTLTVGSNDLDMDKNLYSGDKFDCLYVTVASDINDDLTVKLTGKNLAGKERRDILGVEATYKGIENLELGAKASRPFASDVAANDRKTALEASAKYTHELFTANAKVQANLYPEEATKKNTFGIYIGAESTQIVHGATLSLAYGELTDDGDVKIDYPSALYGDVVAKCVIAF